MKKILSIALVAVMALVSVGCKCEKSQSQDLSFAELMEQSSPEQIQAWYNGASCLDAEYTKANAEALRAQKKLLVFDLDGTLSNHKCPMPEANRALLDELGKRYHLVMCGAGNTPRIFKQMENYPIDIVGNYGMQHSKVVDGELVITKQIVCDIDKEFFTTETDKLRAKYGYTEDGNITAFGKTLTLKKERYNAAADAVTTEREIKALKQRGINCLTPDYPQPRWFYDICDRVGIYVIDCAAISSPTNADDRSLGGTPANAPELVDEYLRRVETMYHRAQNHVCIIAFSLGKKAGNGYNLYKAYELLKSKGDSRAIIYEDAEGEWNTDI